MFQNTYLFRYSSRQYTLKYTSDILRNHNAAF